MKDSSKKKRKRDEEDASRSKKSKEKSSKDKKQHKDKKRKKEDRRKVSEEVLFAAGCLNEDHYFEKHAEFSTWLSEEGGKFFNDLSSDSAHKEFLKFIEAWNSRSLDRKYYEGIDVAPARRTTHRWGLGKEKDETKINKPKIPESRDKNKPDVDEEWKPLPASGRVAFGMGSFCPPKNKESNSQQTSMKEPIGPALRDVGKNAAARMIDGSQADDSGAFAQLKALVDKSSGNIQIRKRNH